jgi:glutathione S-transferase
MDWQFTLADAQRDAFLGMVRTTPDDRDNAAIKKSLSDSARLFGFVEHALTQTPWLSGDTFGIGDIPVGVYVRTFAGIGGDTTTMPHLQNWYKRLQQRPGYACHVMIPLT